MLQVRWRGRGLIDYSKIKLSLDIQTLIIKDYAYINDVRKSKTSLIKTFGNPETAQYCVVGYAIDGDTDLVWTRQEHYFQSLDEAKDKYLGMDGFIDRSYRLTLVTGRWIVNGWQPDTLLEMLEK